MDLSLSYKHDISIFFCSLWIQTAAKRDSHSQLEEMLVTYCKKIIPRDKQNVLSWSDLLVACLLSG